MQERRTFERKCCVYCLVKTSPENGLEERLAKAQSFRHLMARVLSVDATYSFVSLGLFLESQVLDKPN